MTDVREVFESVTRLAPPQPDPLPRQRARQRRAERRRRAGALALVAAMVAVGITVGVNRRGTDGGPAAPALAPGLYRVDVRDHSVTAMTTPTGADDIRPSPNGTLLAYAAPDANDAMQIFVANVDGGEARQLTHDEFGASAPAWSSEGSRIAYLGFGDQGDQQVFIVDSTGGEPTQITDRRRLDISWPAWGPEDGSILIDESSGGSPDGEDRRDVDLRTFEIDLATRRWTPLLDDAVGPDLSPDGRRLAFETYSTYQVTVANLDGHHRATVAPDRTLGAKWSPDGGRIAYQNSLTAEVLVQDLGTGDARAVVRDAELLDWLDDETLLILVR